MQGTFFPTWDLGHPSANLTDVPEFQESTVNNQANQSYAYYATVADQGRVFRKVLEIISAAAATLLGLQFLSSGYAPYDGVYLPMRIVAPAQMWGTLMIVLAALRIIILIINGHWPHSHLARKYLSAAFIFGVWLPLATCFWWNFQVAFVAGQPKTYPGLAYSMFTLGSEFLIYYAHASFVYVTKRG